MVTWTTTNELAFLKKMGTGFHSNVVTPRPVLLKRYREAFLKRDVLNQTGKRTILNIDRILIMRYLDSELKH